ncbi:amino acid ABC transporter permease [Zhihengliuella flava]|uniref:Glutamate transport system permease protein n=1 Tax=Zhihengliuella flava TaxID=1285193 RepID=A0A931D8D5_9MICC|nr:amino acid ABC transporter permease [Zhihengliuella flava]MBG6085540.1 glutamate transport system permease protein [Zhihengliuella flava]
MSSSVLFDEPGPKARRRILILNIIGIIAFVALMGWVLMVLNDFGQLAPAKWLPFTDSSTWQNYLLPGLMNTLKSAAIAVVTSLVFGMIFGMGRLAQNKLINGISSVVVEFFRAVPVLLMMIFFWIFLGRMGVVSPDDAPFVAVVVSLTLYNGSVVAELVRSGVHGLPKGQREAGTAIGLTRGQSLRIIEVPQALVAMMPALLSQFVVILKDSALGQIINYNELLFNAKLVGTANANVFQALVVAAVIFILINFALTSLAQTVQTRVARRRGNAAATEDDEDAAEAAPVGTTATIDADQGPGSGKQ